MTTTTDYDSWNIHHGGSTVTVEDSVAEFLTAFVADYELAELVAAYRALIDAALPPEISLHGNEFYGAYPVTPGAGELIEAAIESVELGALAALFDRTYPLTKIYVHEDNAGAVYLSMDWVDSDDATYGWPLGPVTPDMHGRAERDVQGWVSGEWTPREELYPVAVTTVPVIAVWTAADGLTVERDCFHNPTAGAGGCAYLGVERS